MKCEALSDQGRPAAGDDKAVRLHSRRGWVKVHRRDVALVVQDCASPASVISVWLALLMLSNQARSNPFQASLRSLCALAGTSRSTVKRTVAECQRIGLVTNIERQKTADGLNEENVFTLRNSDGGGSVHHEPTRRVRINRGVGPKCKRFFGPLQKEVALKATSGKNSSTDAPAPSNVGPAPNTRKEPRRW